MISLLHEHQVIDELESWISQASPPPHSAPIGFEIADLESWDSTNFFFFTT